MITRKIKVSELLDFNSEDEIEIDMSPQEVFGILHLSVERTFRNLPNNMKLTEHNKEVVKKLLRTEFVYQSMLFNEQDLGTPQ